jgi:hypothetical protein
MSVSLLPRLSLFLLKSLFVLGQGRKDVCLFASPAVFISPELFIYSRTGEEGYQALASPGCLNNPCLPFIILTQGRKDGSFSASPTVSTSFFLPPILRQGRKAVSILASPAASTSLLLPAIFCKGKKAAVSLLL